MPNLVSSFSGYSFIEASQSQITKRHTYFSVYASILFRQLIFIWKKIKQLVTCALMIWFLLYTTRCSLELIKKKKKRKKYHEVLDTDCTKPIIRFWSCKHGLWFKRTGFHSLSAIKDSTQLSIKATVQAQTAGIQLLALFSPSVDTLAVCAEHWKRLTGTSLRADRQDRDGSRLSRHRGGLHSTGTRQMGQTQAVTNGQNFQLCISV